MTTHPQEIDLLEDEGNYLGNLLMWELRIDAETLGLRHQEALEAQYIRQRRADSQKGADS